MEANRNMSWIIYALLAAFFAALVAIFGKIGVQKIDPTLATTVRAVIMAGFLLIVAFSLGKLKFIATIDSRALFFIVLAGIAGALSWIFYFAALKSGEPTAVVALDRLSIVFVLIFSVIFFSSKVSFASVSGALLVTIGAILLSL